MKTNSEIKTNLYNLADRYLEQTKLEDNAVYVLGDILKAFTGISCEDRFMLAGVGCGTFLRQIANALLSEKEALSATRPILRFKRNCDVFKPDELMGLAKFYDDMIEKYGVLVTPGDTVQYCGIINPQDTEEEVKNA